MPNTKNSKSNIDMQNNISGGQNTFYQFNNSNVNVRNGDVDYVDDDSSLFEEKISFQREVTTEIIKGIVGLISGIVFAIYEDDALHASSLIVSVSFLLLILVFISCTFSMLLHLPSLLLRRNREEPFKKIKIIEFFFPPEKITAQKYFRFKNGELYRIRGRLCPHCEVEPKGRMHIYYNPLTKKDEWRCNENPDHVLVFDPKKRM